MDEDIIVIEEEFVETQTAVSPNNTSRRLFMAGIGIVVSFKGEFSSFVNQVIEQGESATRDNKLPAGKLRRRLRKPVGQLLNRINVPTKTDIDRLNNQISNLIEKVEALEETQTNLTAPTSPESRLQNKIENETNSS